MIAYFDTSAFVPLIVEEPTSVACRNQWAGAMSVCSTRLLYVEAVAALSAAARAGRFGESELTGSIARAAQLWSDVDVIELGEEVMLAAGEVARRFKLRGYDACLLYTSDAAD